jgi:MOSC domain-containing protein
VAPVATNGTLALTFPDGRTVAGPVELGAAVTTDFWGRPVAGRLVEGPWSAALSEYTGDDVELVRTVQPGTGIDVHAGTVVSRASCERLGEELGADVDPRRFRMLLELDGLGAHEEDDWRDRPVRIGDAVVRVRGPVPRCLVTRQDPDTGVPTLDTLRGIKSYRGVRDGTKLDFGVYFDVEQPGRVAVGDAAEPL